MFPVMEIRYGDYLWLAYLARLLSILLLTIKKISYLSGKGENVLLTKRKIFVLTVFSHWRRIGPLSHTCGYSANKHFIPG